MRSTANREWNIRRVVPRHLRRLSWLAVAFYSTILTAIGFVALGVVLIVEQQQLADSPANDIGPYSLILIATAVGLVGCSLIWGASDHAVTVIDPNTEYLSSLAPLHQQGWTFQLQNQKGWAATVVAAIWHGVGLLAFGHYSLVISPSARFIVLFCIYELIGLIPVALAVRGWRQWIGRSH